MFHVITTLLAKPNFQSHILKKATPCNPQQWPVIYCYYTTSLHPVYVQQWRQFAKRMIQFDARNCSIWHNQFAVFVDWILNVLISIVKHIIWQWLYWLSTVLMGFNDLVCLVILLNMSVLIYSFANQNSSLEEIRNQIRDGKLTFDIPW